MAAHAPQVLQTQIAPDQIGLLIGKGGETIRGIQDEFTVQIDVEEDGSVRIYGAGDSAASAREHIDQMMRPMQVGDVLPRAEGRQGVRLRRLRRAPQGHRRPPARLPGRPGRADRRPWSRSSSAAPSSTSRWSRSTPTAAGSRSSWSACTRTATCSRPQDVGERYKLAYPEGERSERPPREDGDRGDRRPRGRGGRDRRPALLALAGASRHDAAERRPGRLRGDVRAPFGGARRLRRRRLAR